MKYPEELLAERVKELEAENAALQQELVDAEPTPYCEVCGSCGEIGCGCTAKCKFPFDHPEVADRIEALTAENERLRARIAKDIEVELSMCAIANEEASGEWIDGFDFAWKRVRAALGDTQ